MEIVLLWVGALFAWIGVLIIRWARSSEGHLRVPGEILGYVARVDAEDGSRTYAPVIGFKHPGGGRRVVESALATNTLPYAVGQRVAMRVDPQDPTRARLETSAFLWFGIAIAALGVGSCILFFAVFDWSWFSVVVALGVSLMLLRGGWRRQEKVDLGEMAAAFRRAVGGGAVEASQFDRSRLLSSAEVDATRGGTVRASRITGIVLLLLACGGAVWSWQWAGRRVEFIERAAAAPGRVVQLVESEGSDTTTWAPVVEFSPPESWPIRFRHSVSSSHPSWRVGDGVRVLYDPADPSQAMIDQGRWNLFGPLLPAAIGLVLGALGILALRQAAASRARDPYGLPAGGALS